MRRLRSHSRHTALFFTLLLSACGGSPDARTGSGEGGDFYEEVSRLNTVLSEIDRKYVEEVDPADLSDAAIQGIRTILDPHTMVFDPKEFDDLKVNTDGEFGGIGITIAIRDNVLTIISPLQGTPAFQMGLQAGDRIIRIDGKSTQGITSDKAVEKLRGKVGTDVTISVAREGVPEPIDYTITRARIQIHSVPYAGIIEGDIGYIKVAQFSQKTAEDLEASLRKLQAQGMKKLILDLRYNPGGLLNQAIAVGELFLRKGDVIVSTRGRTQKTESASSRNPVLSPDVPMVVLVNEGSASAAEIVAGALQDWDRALIVGKTSFGKGSVQTIFPLDNQGHALKLTTAFYYLPMGRCINKPENGIRGAHHDEDEPSDADTDSGDTTITATPDTAKADSQVYYTAGGRKVYGGGGITPDVVADPKVLPWIVGAQERQNLFFKFAVKVRPQLEKVGVSIDAKWQVPDSLFEAYRTFALQDSLFASTKTNAQTTLDILQDMVVKEQTLLGDTTKTVSDPEVAKAVDAMKAALQKNRDTQMAQNQAYLRDAIRRELVAAFLGEEARIAIGLGNDNQVQEAVKLLRDKDAYRKALNPAVATKEKEPKKAAAK